MVYIYSLKLQSNKYYIGKTDNPNFRLENHFDSCGSTWTKKYSPIGIHELRPDCSVHDEQKITQEYMEKYGIDNVRGGPWCKIKIDPSEKEFIQKLFKSKNDECYKCGSSDHFAKDCKKSKKSVPKIIRKKLNNCSRCGRLGHSEDKCYAKTDSKGKTIYEEDFNEFSWSCEFCEKEFDSEKGCRFHENVHCPKRRGKKKKNFDSCKALYDEVYSSDDEDEEDEYSSSDDEEDDIICFKCGRPGHYATKCYAKKHKRGYQI